MDRVRRAREAGTASHAELTRRYAAALEELYGLGAHPGKKYRVRGSELARFLEALENNLAVLRWLKKARLVGALARVVKERRRLIELEPAHDWMDTPDDLGLDPIQECPPLPDGRARPTRDLDSVEPPVSAGSDRALRGRQ